MAFPVVQDADTQSGLVTANDSTWDMTYPTNLAAGDLILCLMGTDGNGINVSSFSDGGWVAGTSSTDGTATLIINKKKALGSETGTVTATITASEQGCWRMLRITGWGGTLGTDFNNGGANSGSCPIAGASGSSTTPDPPSLNPFNWGVEETLWIAAAASDHGNTTYTGFPSGFGSTSAQESGGAGGAALGTARLNDAVVSTDPGTFTTDANEGWSAFTIAVRPIVVPWKSPYPQLFPH